MTNSSCYWCNFISGVIVIVQLRLFVLCRRYVALMMSTDGTALSQSNMLTINNNVTNNVNNDNMLMRLIIDYITC